MIVMKLTELPTPKQSLNLNRILTDQYFIVENTDTLLPLRKGRSVGSFWEVPKLLCHSVMPLPLYCLVS